ncbi:MULTISPECIES: alkaline phosphatase family protein [Thioalkalivibrio]|uniref:alkaline phosphatase family protein n=1 Tax=Thioalkalivibrio TaxID=106633 RepID=UPI00037EC782|nr:MULTISPECIES: alkaline phosphatase family protein [Thioalkalivibrio]OOC49484.1 nucleotide pyrophosphatase [Thioalkalivibrio versutus]
MSVTATPTAHSAVDAILRARLESPGLMDLLGQIEASLNAAASHPPLAGVSEHLGPDRHIVLWLIDGFAARYRRHTPLLGADHVTDLETVFPSTTATAITSILTGRHPARHGLLGWHTRLAAAERTLTVLMGQERGADDHPATLGYRELTGRVQPDRLGDRLDCGMTFIGPEWIGGTPYNRMMSRGADFIGFEDLSELPARVAAHVNATPGPHFTYVYWSELDHLGHEYGPDSPEVERHLKQLDLAYTATCAQIQRQESVFLTTADHGMRTVERRLDLREHPAVQACLRHRLTGEPRAALAHIRTGQHADFLQALERAFGDDVLAIPQAEWLGHGTLGPEPQHPELRARAGDYLLLPVEDAYLVDPPADDEGPFFVGAHGGLSPEERHIPLFLRNIGQSR